MVHRRELLDAVWEGQEVGDEALTVVISRLRHHFAQIGIGEDVIETVPKSGYRLVNTVPANQDMRQTDAGDRVVRRLAWAALAISVAALLIALGTLALHLGMPV